MHPQWNMSSKSHLQIRIIFARAVGRAGRTGVPSRATLHFNNPDIAANKEHVTEPMKAYCKLQES